MRSSQRVFQVFLKLLGILSFPLLSFLGFENLRFYRSKLELNRVEKILGFSDAFPAAMHFSFAGGDRSARGRVLRGRDASSSRLHRGLQGDVGGRPQAVDRPQVENRRAQHPHHGQVLQEDQAVKVG